jgi:hypothetical protein
MKELLCMKLTHVEGNRDIEVQSLNRKTQKT